MMVMINYFQNCTYFWTAHLSVCSSNTSLASAVPPICLQYEHLIVPPLS